MTARAWVQRLHPPAGEAPVLLVVGGITLIALALRWPLFTDALFGDEVTTYGVVSGHSPADVWDLIRSNIENTPPLFYFIAAASERVVGGAEGLRLPALLAGVAAIPLTYLLGTVTVGKRAGVVAAALMAVSPFLIFYSTEARSYALVMAIVVLSTLALLRALEHGGRGWWIAYALASCAAMWTNYTAGFILLAQLTWALGVHRAAWRPLLGSNIAAAIGFLPWLPGFLEDSRSPTNIYDRVRPFSLDVAREDLITWTVGHPYVAVSDLGGKPGVWLSLAGLALGALGFVIAYLRRPPTDRRLRPSSQLVLVLMLAAAVPVGGALYSTVGETVFTPRYLTPSLPALALALAALLTAGEGSFRFVPALLCVGGLAIGGVKALDADFQRPDYEAAVEFIESSGPPNSPVAAISTVSWGPQTPMEAALGPPHESRPGGHPVFIVDYDGGFGAPDVTVRHSFLHRRVSVLFWAAYSIRPTTAQHARAAGQLAGDGTIFFVSEEGVRPVPPHGPDPPPPEFLQALPPGFRQVESRDFPGFPGRSLRVYVFRRMAAER